MDTHDAAERIPFNGHMIPADRADQFRHADDGRPLSDDEYDESRARVAAVEKIEAELGRPLQTWEPL